MSLIAFDIPATAAMAIKIDQAQAIAQLTDVPDTRLTFSLEAKTCHVKCSTQMAICLVEALRHKAVVGDVPRPLLIDCSEAIMAIFAAIEREIKAVRN